MLLALAAACGAAERPAAASARGPGRLHRSARQCVRWIIQLTIHMSDPAAMADPRRPRQQRPPD